MSELNIVDLIENNPITRLSNIYKGTLLNKIREKFNDNEQQLFVGSFYSYLNYNAKTDFVIDLDNIWKWLGFKQKVNAKTLLEKHFIIDIDYKNLLLLQQKQDSDQKKHGGYNKETIMLTIYAFKKFCLKAGTQKADQIHEYYLKLEETLQEVCNEESNELKLQLENKDKQLENVLTTSQKEKELLREKTIVEQFSNNVQCVYYGIIDDVSDENEPLIKFGNSNCLPKRIEVHKKTFTNFRLVNAFKVDNKTQIENIMKTHESLCKYRRTITINKANYTELLSIKELSFEKLDKLIRNIIMNIEFSPYNYKKLVDENIKCNKKCDLLEGIVNELKEENKKLKLKNLTITSQTFSDTSLNALNIKNLLLNEDNQRLKADNIRLIKKSLKPVQTPIVTEIEPISEETGSQEIDYNDVTKSLKRISKNYSDGLYYIGNKTYKSCFGTREEVWKEEAYKTSGGLMKEDLMMNKDQKIVSKKKFIIEKQNNRLEEVNKARKP